MKLANKEILANTEGLATLLQEGAPLPAVISFSVIRNYKNLLPIAEDVEHERLKIAQRYGKETEDGTFYIPEENRETAMQELNDLSNVTTSVPIMTFSLDKLSGYDIPLKTMNILYFMVEDGEV